VKQAAVATAPAASRYDSIVDLRTEKVDRRPENGKGKSFVAMWARHDLIWSVEGDHMTAPERNGFGEALVKTEQGSFWLDPDDQVVSKDLLLNGSYGTAEIRLAANHIERNDRDPAVEDVPPAHRHRGKSSDLRASAA
jgi:hypothetical protein